MTPYPYDTITMNGREVTIQKIVNRSVVAASDFEHQTFDFVADWISGRESFNQKTSGSTGDPKQVAISRILMIASANLSIEALNLQQGYNALLCISPEYIGGKMMLVRSLIGGMKIIATTPTSNPFNSLPPDLHIDFAAMVPYQVREIVHSPIANKFHEIKKIIIGGAALDKDTEARLREYRCLFYSTYGMTETVSHIALRQLNGKEASDCYRALPGIKISTDERNCLIIEWNPLPKMVITNDMVEIVSKDTFRWIGRWDNVINTGGVKVIPEKVEKAIQYIFDTLKIHNTFFVGSVADEGLGNKVTLFIEGSLEGEMIETIKIRMADAIPRLEAPRQVILINSFTLTESGKVNRKETTKPYMGSV
jgi:o-succinylbenzoate---CoA ligase